MKLTLQQRKTRAYILKAKMEQSIQRLQEVWGEYKRKDLAERRRFAEEMRQS